MEKVYGDYKRKRGEWRFKMKQEIVCTKLKTVDKVKLKREEIVNGKIEDRENF